MKYYTVNEYVDIETGEIITESLAKRKYIILKINKTNEKQERNNQQYTKILRQMECRENKQCEIHFN